MAGHTNLAYVTDEEFSRRDNEELFTNSNFDNDLSIVNRPKVHEVNIGIRSKRRYLAVGIMCFINLINYMDRFTIAGVLEKVQDYYHIGETEGGLLQTSFIVSYMIMAPVFGYLGDRYSRKLIIAGGVTFWSATTLLGSFVPSHLFGLFLLCRALVGTGEASYSTIAPTIIADLFAKDQRSKMLAVFYFAIPVGSGLGYIVGDQLTTYFGEWQYSLRLTPILGIASVILTLLFVSDPPRGEAEGGTKLEVTSLTTDIGAIVKIKSYIYVTLGFTCVSFATGALAWFGPKYMEKASIRHAALGKIPPKAALIFGIITCIAGIVGVVIGSSSSQYFRKFNLKADPLICAFGVLASVPLAFAGLILADYNMIWSWILIFLGMVCLCVNWTIVADIVMYVIIPTRRGIAEAVQILICHALGDATSPYIIGIVSDALVKSPQIDKFLSLQYALYIPMIVLVLGGMFFFMASMYVETDKAKCSLAIHGEQLTLSYDSLYDTPVMCVKSLENARLRL